MSVRILIGDCRERLRELPDASVHCCVTSPPYFGLRDYGVAGQMGLEPTPDEFVAGMVEVFREVRRVLRDDGTLWLNIGDSYSSSSTGDPKAGSTLQGGRANQVECAKRPDKTGLPGIKTKDLIGIPWMLAKALRDSYYTGRIRAERDRVWMAAMLDAEGCLCGTEYETAGRTKTNIYISITNSATSIIDECERIFPQAGKHVYAKQNPVNRQVYRWDVERMETKAMFVREIYPYLIAKRKQAILAYTFLEMQKGLVSKKKGYLADQHEQRSWLMQSLSTLNQGGDVDLPGWVIEPPSLFEPGYYLRQDIIWSKPNPMPESVRDRCTKAHEYLFLLSKGPRYYYDAEAIAEPVAPASVVRLSQDVDGQSGSDRVPGKTNGTMKAVAKGGKNAFRGQGANRANETGPANRDGRDMSEVGASLTRNKRSVWEVATQPFSEAHFATYPPALIEPCILAGCPKGGTVLDPFGGAGTTGLVADRIQRDAILIELNPEYAAIAQKRLSKDGGMFSEVLAA